MKILIGYATTEGQTRKVCRFCANALADLGHAVELLPLSEASDLEVSQFDGAILAGSVHTHSYQKVLIEFASDHAAALHERPTMFLSVSLSAAGSDASDWAGLKNIEKEFTSKSGWSPDRVEHVAGAFRFSEYDFLKSWAMRWIAAEKGEEIDVHGDTEYTDWDALRVLMADFTEGAR